MTAPSMAKPGVPLLPESCDRKLRGPVQPIIQVRYVRVY
jgi:hypothetical protein